MVKKATRKKFPQPKSKTVSKKPFQKTSKLIKLKDYVALAIVDAGKYQDTNTNIIKDLIKAGVPGVYVTLNKPYSSVKKIFKDKKVDTNNVIFIDAVTKTVKSEVKKQKDCLYIGNPKNLSDISIAMDQAIMAIPAENKFLFFDSLSTLLLYNDINVVSRFVHFLSGKMRVWKVKGIIISLRRKKEKDLIDELKTFCDVTLDL